MAQTSAPKILVVDDEKSVRDITQAFLTLNGYAVTTAENGKEAFDELLNNHYDVVITDMQMPLMGGMELLEKISQMTSKIITILLSNSLKYRVMIRTWHCQHNCNSHILYSLIVYINFIFANFYKKIIISGLAPKRMSIFSLYSILSP